MKKFVDLYLEGKATINDIDDMAATYLCNYRRKA
jgi:hypothetical protein